MTMVMTLYPSRSQSKRSNCFSAVTWTSFKIVATTFSLLDSIFSFIMTIIIGEGNLDRIAISKFLNNGWVLQILYHLNILQNCHHHLILVLILDSIFSFIMSHDNHHQPTSPSPLIFLYFQYLAIDIILAIQSPIARWQSRPSTFLVMMHVLIIRRSPRRQSYQHSRPRCLESSRSSLWTVPFSEEDKNTKSKLCVRLSFDPLSFPPKFVYKFASY